MATTVSEFVDITVRGMLKRGVHTEADIQSSIKAVLLAADIGLKEDGVLLEDPMGDGSKRRIDIRFGQAIIETKRTLAQTDLTAALEQLTGYVATRSSAYGVPFIGILTDGRDWRLYDLIDDEQSWRGTRPGSVSTRGSGQKAVERTSWPNRKRSRRICPKRPFGRNCGALPSEQSLAGSSAH